MDKILSGKDAEHLQKLLDKYHALKAAKDKGDAVDKDNGAEANS